MSLLTNSNTSKRCCNRLCETSVENYVKLSACGGCAHRRPKQFYCGKLCQHQDWPNHKNSCLYLSEIDERNKIGLHGMFLRKTMASSEEEFNDANRIFAASAFELGKCYEDGKGVAPDITKAMKMFKSSARRGHAESQYRLGQYYFKSFSGVPFDTTKALKWISMAADQGHAGAQLDLQKYYRENDNMEVL